MFAGAEEGVGIVAEECVVGGLAGLGDGVAVGLGAVTPSVEDGEDYRCFGHDGFVSRWYFFLFAVLVRISTKGRGDVGWRDIEGATLDRFFGLRKSGCFLRAVW